MQMDHRPMFVMSGDDRWEVIAGLVLAVGRGTASFGALWSRLAPEVERWMASPRFLGRLSGEEDHRREVVVRTWVRLRDRDHARLRAFATAELASYPDRAARVRAWLRRVVKNVGIDYLRGLPEFIRTGAPEGETRRYWHVLEAAEEDAAAYATTDADPRARVLVEQMLGYLDRASSARGSRSPARARERGLYRAAIERWLHGFDNDEIACQLGLADAAAADRILGSAKELLRRRFRDASAAMH